MDDIVFEIGYRLSLSREEKEVVISRETLSAAKMKMESEPIRLYLWITKEIKRMPFFKPQKKTG